MTSLDISVLTANYIPKCTEYKAACKPMRVFTLLVLMIQRLGDGSSYCNRREKQLILVKALSLRIATFP